MSTIYRNFQYTVCTVLVYLSRSIYACVCANMCAEHDCCCFIVCLFCVEMPFALAFASTLLSLVCVRVAACVFHLAKLLLIAVNVTVYCEIWRWNELRFWRTERIRWRVFKSCFVLTINTHCHGVCVIILYCSWARRANKKEHTAEKKRVRSYIDTESGKPSHEWIQLNPVFGFLSLSFCFLQDINHNWTIYNSCDSHRSMHDKF